MNDNWNESVKVLRLEVDPGQGARFGRDQPVHCPGVAGDAVGMTVGAISRGRQADRHVLRQPWTSAGPSPTLPTPTCPRPSGKSIPLTQIAKPVFAWGARRDVARKPANTPSRYRGDVVEGMQGATVTQMLLPELRDRRDGKGRAGSYRIVVAGAVAESSKGSSSIAAGVPIMLFITFTLLMLQLHSFNRAVLVFLTRRWYRRGGGALLLLGQPFGFVALLGVIALMGMIQRNSVILDRPDREPTANAACRCGMPMSRRPCAVCALSC